MPDGLVKWFDERTGEVEVVRRGRLFPASVGDVESEARHPGARVHFDIARKGGVDRAVEVRLRPGTRVSRRQHHFGSLEGATTFEDKGAASYARVHPELRSARRHPLEVVRAFATALASGDIDGAASLYAPDAVVHDEGHDLAGRAGIKGFLSNCPVLDSKRHARIESSGPDVIASWEPVGADAPGLVVRSRISHLLIAEQWVFPPEPLATWTREGEQPPLELAMMTKGDVGEEAKADAVEAVLRAGGTLDEPLLFARLKLAFEPDPARLRPASAQAALDLNGELVRAHAAARTMPEAIDLLEHRLRERLERRAEHFAHPRPTGAPHPGEWRHDDLPTERPPYFDRPVESRELVRHKTFAADELTPDEAVFDMEQLDYDFYLFTDLASGLDSIVERLDSGTYQMTRLRPTEIDLGPTAEPIEVIDAPAPVLSLAEATTRLCDSNEPHVFFADPETGRGNVLYRRYDGHYGLVTPE